MGKKLKTLPFEIFYLTVKGKLKNGFFFPIIIAFTVSLTKIFSWGEGRDCGDGLCGVNTPQGKESSVLSKDKSLIFSFNAYKIYITFTSF